MEYFFFATVQPAQVSGGQLSEIPNTSGELTSSQEQPSSTPAPQSVGSLSAYTPNIASATISTQGITSIENSQFELSNLLAA